MLDLYIGMAGLLFWLTVPCFSSAFTT